MIDLKVGDIVKELEETPKVVTRVPDPDSEFDIYYSFLYADGVVDEMYVDNVEDDLSWGDMKVVGHMDISKVLEEIDDKR